MAAPPEKVSDTFFGKGVRHLFLAFGVLAELLRIALYEGRLTRELQRLKAELAAMQRQRHDEASQARGEARWAAQQAAEPPEVSTDEAAAWLRAERSGLGALKEGRLDA